MAHIGNMIGTFIKVEEVLNLIDSSSHPRVLLNMEEGNLVPDYVTLSIDKGVWKQTIDVWEGEVSPIPEEVLQNSRLLKGKGLEADKLLNELELWEY